MCENSELQLLPYGFCLDYARRYDEHWIALVAYLIEVMSIYYRTKNKIAYNSLRKVPSVAKIFPLPDEFVFEMFGYLDGYSLLQVAEVNKSWHSMSSSNELWDQALRHDYGCSAAALVVSADAKSHDLIIHQEKCNNATKRSSCDTKPPKLIYLQLMRTYHNLIFGCDRPQALKILPTIPYRFLRG